MNGNAWRWMIGGFLIVTSVAIVALPILNVSGGAVWVLVGIAAFILIVVPATALLTMLRFVLRSRTPRPR
jgi:hypothetical protein